MQDKNVHKKHRQRIRKRYEKYGSESFELHQLLEMLLFHSLRREDTNPVAHKILDAHPDIGLGISDSEELTDVEGVGPVTANLLHIATDTVLATLTEQIKRTPMNSAFSRMEYLWLWYKNKPGSRVAVLLLDSKNRFVGCVPLSVRPDNMTKSYETALVSAFKKYNAAHGVLSHRHRDNSVSPSVEDIYLTGYLKRALKNRGYELLSHYIITDTDCIECPAGEF